MINANIVMVKVAGALSSFLALALTSTVTQRNLLQFLHL